VKTIAQLAVAHESLPLDANIHARVEVVAHNVKDLSGGKVLDKLPELLKRMRDMLVRCLGTVQSAHVAFLDEGAFERWSKPTKRSTQRLARIDLNKARNRHRVDAVVALATRPHSFTLAHWQKPFSSARASPSRPTRHAASPTIWQN
jgi:hypothetical protein